MIEYIELEGEEKEKKAQGTVTKGKKAERKEGLEKATAWHLEHVQRLQTKTKSSTRY